MKHIALLTALLLSPSLCHAGTITVTDSISVEQIGDRIPSETGFGFVAQRPTDDAIGLTSGLVSYWLEDNVWVARERWRQNAGGPVQDNSHASAWVFGDDGAEYLFDRVSGIGYKQTTEGAGWTQFASGLVGPAEALWHDGAIFVTERPFSEARLSRVDTNGTVTQLGDSGGAFGMAVLDSNTLVMASQTQDIISTFDLTTNTRTTLFDYGDIPGLFFDIAVLPSGDFLTTVHTGFVEGRGNTSQLWRIDSETGDVTILADSDIQLYQLYWLADGRLATTAYDWEARSDLTAAGLWAAALDDPTNLSQQAFTGDLANASGLDIGQPTQVPEPSAWALLVIGAVGLGLIRRV